MYTTKITLGNGAYGYLYLLTRAMKNRSSNDMVEAFDALICTLTDCGLNPQLQQLDNETSRALTRFLTSQEIDFQLAPPHMHQRIVI
jgi:hypothetical protein